MGLFSRLFKKSPPLVIDPYMLDLQQPTQFFNEKYKDIVDLDLTSDYMSRVFWINSNLTGDIKVLVMHSYCGKASNNKWVVAKVTPHPAILPPGVYAERVYIGFADPSDALIFKIRFT